MPGPTCRCPRRSPDWSRRRRSAPSPGGRCWSSWSLGRRRGRPAWSRISGTGPGLSSCFHWPCVGWAGTAVVVVAGVEVVVAAHAGADTENGAVTAAAVPISASTRRRDFLGDLILFLLLKPLRDGPDLRRWQSESCFGSPCPHTNQFRAINSPESTPGADRGSGAPPARPGPWTPHPPVVFRLVDGAARVEPGPDVLRSNAPGISTAARASGSSEGMISAPVPPWGAPPCP